MAVQADASPSGGGTTSHKKHRVKQSGPKAAKKQTKALGASQHNVKAFAVQHTTKAARLVQRTLDYQTRKHHVPQSEHVVDASPPIIVALVGPPKSGKSTLLKSLLRHFAHQAIGVVKGPLTVVVGKKLRLTFIECGCDINSMLDTAKIADVVLLMVNVRIGLEMYHFEFINMIQVHGMPRVIPVLNHLDTFKDSSSSRAVRRKIKQRLWVDLNSKIFLLTRFQPKKYPTYDIQTNEYSKPGDYLLAEVRRLARMVVVKIPHSTDWRTGHSYLLIDRLEDITDNTSLAKTPDADRTVSMYGWVRGAPLPPVLTSPAIHIAGLGDVTLANCTRQPDPCPLPCHVTQGAEKPSRHLAERERKIYAPMSSLGGVLFDRDATYIDLGGSHYLTHQHSRDRRINPSKLATQTALDQIHSTFTQTGGLDDQLARTHRVQILGDTSYVTADTCVPSDEAMHSADEPDDDSQEEAVEAAVASEAKEEEVPLFSDNFVAGFLVPAGTKQADTPIRTPPIPSGTQVSKSAHLTVKQVLDDIDWKSTTPSRLNWNRIIYEQDASLTDSTSGVVQSSLTVGLVPSTKGGSSTLETEVHDFTLPPSRVDRRYGDSIPFGQLGSQFDWSEPGALERVSNRFTTGQWDVSEDATTLLQSDAQARAQLTSLTAHEFAAASSSHVQYKPSEEPSMSEGDRRMVDDESSPPSQDLLDTDDETSMFEGSDSGSDSSDTAINAVGDGDGDGSVDPNAEFEKRLLRPTKRQKLQEKRQRHKALFNKLYEAAGGGPEATAFYDKLVAAKEAQMAANRAVLQTLPEEAMEQLEGFPPGAYVRLEFKGIPHQFMDRFNPCQPLVAGVLPSAEDSMGYVQVRMRTHRWLKRILRSNDPITVSIGWRRYQTVAVFSKEEHNLRNRYLKYSLPHEHCLMTIYGPLVPPKTGVVLFVNSAWRPQASDDASGLPTFRVAGTGSVVSIDQSFQIMKKLKLIGEPFKIFTKTAFIRGMFNSALEVSKMLGVRIQTVSGVRGLIKAALTNPSTSKPGDFRATFEAQIGKADLVSLRSFIAVKLPRYYNPVLNRLCPIAGELQHGDGDGDDQEPKHQQWRLLRTLTELRQVTGVKSETRPDSHYKPIRRPVFVPTPLYVPTKLVSALPFAHKPKPSRKEARRMLGGDPVQDALFADLPPPVKPSSELETRQDLLTRLRQLHADFKRRQREKMITRVSKHQKDRAMQEQRRARNQRKQRKTFFARHGNKLARKAMSDDN